MIVEKSDTNDDLMYLLGDSFDRMCKELAETRKELIIKLYLIKAVNSGMTLREVIRNYYVHEEPDRSLKNELTSYNNVDCKILINKQETMTYGARMVLLKRDKPYEDTRGIEDFVAEVLNYLMKGIQA